MFYEQRGPLVFSASIHLVLLVGAALWMLISPEKEKEPFNFELVPPPAGGFAPAEAPPTLDMLETIEYESQPIEELPTLDDIVLPERETVVIEVEMPAEPEPEVEVVKPKQISAADFFKNNSNDIKNVRTTPVKQPKRTPIDIPKFAGITIGNVSAAEIASYSAAEQDALGSYIAGFKARLKVESHPIRGSKLSVLVSCDILGNGTVQNIRIIDGSGDAEFDRKVVAAYRKLARVNAPPKGEALIGLQIEVVQSW